MSRAKFISRSKWFFQRLKARKERGKRDAIYSVSGLIATTAKNMLRLRPGPSRPPAAPHAHTRGGLRLIRFAVDRNTSIIGPIRFPRSNQYNEPIPHVHEFGKTVFSIRRSIFYRFQRRPYMSKALESLKRRGKIPKHFSVRMGKVL